MEKYLKKFTKDSNSISKSESIESKMDHTESKKYILKCTWKNIIFKLPEIIAYIKRFNRIAITRINSSGIDIGGLDLSHVTKFNIHLDQTDFYNFEFTGTYNLIIPINFEHLSKNLLKFNSSKDKINVILSAEDFVNKVLCFECRNIFFATKFSELSEKEYPDSQLKTEISCTIPLFDLIEFLEFAQSITNFITLETNLLDKSLNLKGISKDTTIFHRSFKINSTFSILNHHIQEYFVVYFLEACKITANKNILKNYQITLAFSTNKPLYLSISLTRNSRIEIIIAPRITED